MAVQPDGCWLWKGESETYGRFDGRSVHRFVFSVLVGPIRKGAHIHHECGNKGCCNPAHLREMTPSEHQREHHRLRLEREA